MICDGKPPAQNLPEGRGQSRNYGAQILRAIAIAAGAALLIALLLLSLGKYRLSETGRTLLTAFVYSTLIALPSIVLLTRISHRYGDRFPRLIVLMQAMVLVCTAIAGSLGADLIFLIAGLFPRSDYWAQFRGSAPFSVVITLMFGLSMATYETLRYRYQAATLELRTKQVEQERAYKLLAEAQLSSLESRIHPHFLFNTLNSIAALIPSNPQLAEDTVGKLASLLRFSLNANHTGLVPLSKELKVVRDYLEIEKTRFGPRLSYEIAVPAALNDVKVPPLALQSLVENSVKHVVSQRAQGARIQVRGSIASVEDSDRICLEVLDDGPGFSLDAITPEHGLGNLIARIELLFGPAGRLQVTRENEMTVVRFSFPV
jgi:sensor histidine kinase YesM